jgi:hypothetical protein
MPKLVCVVIPVYQAFEKLPPSEVVAWRQCLRVLNQHPISIVCPPHLSTEPYLADARQHGVQGYVNTFAADFFNGIDGYNRLLLRREFYQAFQEYQYMLLYQLDAFVFRDELATWCARGYSYIGAPWFTDYRADDDTAQLWKVGNGGFTLRNVADALRVLKTFAPARAWSAVVQEHFQGGVNNGLLHLPGLLRALVGNNTHWRLNGFHRYRALHQEDYFWGVVCPERFSWYKVPTPKQALAFSFEVRPSRMYALNQQHLPMGCHAWEKHEPYFWQPFIEQAISQKGVNNPS